MVAIKRSISLLIIGVLAFAQAPVWAAEDCSTPECQSSNKAKAGAGSKVANKKKALIEPGKTKEFAESGKKAEFAESGKKGEAN